MSFVCLMGLRANLVLAASRLDLLTPTSSHSSNHDQIPAEDQDLPAPVEGGEAELESEECTDHTFCVFALHVESSPFLWSVLHSRSLPVHSSPCELLQRLRI